MLKKYILSMFLALTLVLCFAGCNAGVISTAPSETPTVSRIVTTAVSETQSSTEKETTTKAVTTSAAPSVSIKEETQPSSVITTAAKKAKTTVTAAAEKKTKKKKNKNKKIKDNNKSVKNKATTEQTENKNEQKCTVTIECSEIYRNLDKLKEGHERFLPENGVFVNKYECKINEGDTVYDVIQRAAKTKNLKVTVRHTQFGLYISGINELDEFDVGNTSGWVYYLNGEFGRVSAGNCPVKNGDDVLFKYTCGE